MEERNQDCRNFYVMVRDALSIHALKFGLPWMMICIAIVSIGSVVVIEALYHVICVG